MSLFDFTSWLRQAFPRSNRAAKRNPQQKTQPLTLERLEDRTVPAILNPGAFTSLGAFTPLPGSYTVDTTNLTLTGPGNTNFTGVNSNGIAVFDFSDVSIGGSVTITAQGTRPWALLSQNNLTVSGTIYNEGASASYFAISPAVGGPGGGAGGSTHNPGQGSGGGAPGADTDNNSIVFAGAGGGGFGGAGATGQSLFGDTGGAGGAAYGDLVSQLQGGSGGGGGSYVPYKISGGGGGGAIELGALNSLLISSTGAVHADGGNGSADGYGGSGGGSGGAILIHAPTAMLAGSLTALGGQGGSGTTYGDGGPGGGGRVAIEYGQLTNTATISVAGGRNATGNPTILFADAGQGREDAVFPTITSLSQTSAAEGASSFTLTVNGANYASNATVDWNGVALATSFVNSGQLTATVPTADLTEEGSASVTVVNPTTGDTSTAQNFTINDAALTSVQGVGTTQNATEGQSTTVTLATFEDAGNPSGATDDYTADVNFGDNTGPQTNVPITVTYDSGSQTFTVTAAHTFAEESGGTPFTVTTQMHHGATTDPAPVTAAVSVADADVLAPLAPTTLDTTASWTQEGEPRLSYYFGNYYPSYVVPTVGQVITATPSDSVLTSFSFEVNEPAGYTFQAEVYAWNPGAREATGSSLYESSPVSTAGSGYQLVTFNTGSLQLVAGQNYILFLSTAKITENYFNGYVGVSYVGTNATDQAFAQYDQGSPSLWTQASWGGQFPADLAYTATFASPQPAISVNEGASFSGPVAKFSDVGYPGNSPSDFTATIDWGDNTVTSTADANTTVSVTGSNGLFTVSGAHTYAEEGMYPVKVTLTDGAPGTATAEFDGIATVNDVALTQVQGVTATQSATEGLSATVTLATFQDAGNPNGDIKAEDYTADVNFGDGTGLQTNVPISISYNNGAFTVSATHAYAEESAAGTHHTVTTHLHHEGTADPSAVTASVAASDAAVMAAAGQAVVNAPAGGSTNLVLLATFTDPGGTEAIGDYSATVDWGDGTSPRDTENTTDTNPNIFIVQAGNRFLVEGTHVYTAPGGYTIATTIHHDTAPDASVQESALIASAAGTALSPTGGFTYTTTEGLTPTGTQTLATFTDLGGADLDHSQVSPTPEPGVYAATVSWGDGSAPDTTATITVDSNGLFTVSGSHVYQEEGTYTVGVTLQRTGAPNVSVTSTAIVADAPLTLVSDVTTNVPTGVLEGQFTGAIADLATFTDPGGQGKENVNDFAATILWGDNSTSAGTVVHLTGGNFQVNALGHTYAEDGGYTIQVSVVHDGLAAVTSSGQSITIGEAAVSTPVVAAVNAVEGAAAAPITGLATFTDAAGVVAAGDVFTATINWGDSVAVDHNATVTSLGGGSYRVDATVGHSYAEEGPYTVTVTVTHDALTPVVGTGAATVSDPQITGLALETALSGGTEGAATAAVNAIATFTDPGGFGNETAADFTGTIAWGDGGSSAAQVAATGTAGVYQINDTTGHLYAEEGTYHAIVSVQHEGLGVLATSAQNVVITDPAIPAVTDAGTLPTGVVEGQSTGAIAGVATFTDPGGQGKENVGDFTATILWGDTTTSTGTVVSLGSGAYQVNAAGHPYAEDGGYTIQVSVVHDGLAAVTSHGRSITIGEAAVSTPVVAAVNAVEGHSVGVVTGLATFRDAAGVVAPGDVFTATVDWGDGPGGHNIVSASVAPLGDGNYRVDGPTHTYGESGAYTVTVVVTHDGAPGTAGVGLATVADVQISNLAVVTASLPTNGTEGAAVGPITNLARFNDPAADITDDTATGSEFTATVNWGDGATTSAMVAFTGTSNINEVNDPTGHTYAEAGTYAVSVTVQHNGLSSVTSAGMNVAIADAALTVQSVAPPTAVEGAGTGVVTVATFTDADPNGTASDYSAKIHWGDTTSVGAIVDNGDGTFSVTGSHTYAEEGATAGHFVVDVKDNGGATNSLDSGAAVTVADARLTVGQIFAPTAVVEGASTGTLTLATFTDADPAGALGDYSASIQWGDGSSMGTVVDNHDGTFSVTGSHTYAEEGATANAFAVTVNDNGATATRTGNKVSVADAALSSTAADLTPPAVTAQGGSISNQVLLHFTDADPSGTAADYTATVTWGDGTSNTSADLSGTVSVVAHTGGGFDVRGSHSYGHAFSNAGFGVSVADHNATTSQSTTISVSATYPLAAEFPGSGVWRYVNTGDAAANHWQQLTPADATLTAIDANGDVVAEFSIARYGSHGGVWRYQDATGWVQLTNAALNPNAEPFLLAVDAAGHVFADFKGYGLQEYVSGTTWMSVQPAGVPTSVDATLLAVGANGDAAAAFHGYGVWRHLAANPPTNWLRLTVSGMEDASLLAMDGHGDVFADFMHYGVDEYLSGTSWTSIQPPELQPPDMLAVVDAALLAAAPQ